MNPNFKEVLSTFDALPNLANPDDLAKLKDKLGNIDDRVLSEFFKNIKKPTSLLLDQSLNPFKNEYEDKGEVEDPYGGIYNFIRDEDNPGDFIDHYDISAYDVDILMDAITQHEHRGAIDDPNYSTWIRTRESGSGSSAFGPGQITKGLLNVFTTPGERVYYDVEGLDKEMHQKMLEKSGLMLKYGGADMVKGWEDYDYGGPGG